MVNRPEFIVLLNELKNRLEKCNVELDTCPVGALQKMLDDCRLLTSDVIISSLDNRALLLYSCAMHGLEV